MSKLSILLLFCTFSVAHATPTTETFGYFTGTFLNQGDKIDGYVTESAKTWGGDQIACVGRALNAWMDVLGVKAPTRNINVIFKYSSGSAVGGSSSLWTKKETSEDGTYAIQSSSAEALWKEGYDDNSKNKYDIVVNLSPDKNFYTGEDVTGLASDQYDMQSIIFHEIGHSLGFHSNCSGWCGSDKELPLFTTWDLLMKDSNGNPVSATNNDYKIGETFTIGSANKPIYNVTGNGSGMSHLLGDFVMQPGADDGTAHRTLTKAEIQLMREMGWTIGSNVPEPSSCFLALIGATFLLLHRRRAC
ncbi:MAG: hypothetical protein RR250_06600 [Akkermansia sp.]